MPLISKGSTSCGCSTDHTGATTSVLLGIPGPARLSELAKRLGGVAVSGAALGRADQSEAQRWHVIESKVLRGRNNSTDIAIRV
jgi:hypothetical protein